MILEAPGKPLRLTELLDPRPAPGQILVRVKACGICRTDLHVVDGDLTESKLPIVPGHQIVGEVAAVGEGVQPGQSEVAAVGEGVLPGQGEVAAVGEGVLPGQGEVAAVGEGVLPGQGEVAAVGEGVQPGQGSATAFRVGQRMGIPWLGGSCGHCAYCREGRENLCDEARYTGYQIDGGFAELCVADARFCFPIPEGYPDLQAAPLLCAGLIGYRSLRMAGEGRRLGFYGFGAAAHILVQVARWQGREVYAFTRAGDEAGQAFARSLGAVWTGAADTAPPEPLDAAIIFAPAGELVPAALRAVHKGGTVVCAGIHMSDIPSFPYSILWGERVVRSVANLTRRDGEEFLALAPQVPVRTEVHAYPLQDANRALDDLRAGRFTGAGVLVVNG
jgi:propanol-preferring alcohol dehydrogenase